MGKALTPIPIKIGTSSDDDIGGDWGGLRLYCPFRAEYYFCGEFFPSQFGWAMICWPFGPKEVGLVGPFGHIGQASRLSSRQVGQVGQRNEP
jgi:hypothetical protein